MGKKQFNPGRLLTTAIIFLALSANAQHQDSSSATLLNEVMVTATRTEKKLMDIGRSVTVLTGEDIKKTGTHTVAELLNLMEGFYVVGAQQSPGSLSTVFSRGANGNQTVILIDGFRVTDPSSTDRTIDLSELSLANIEKIEVVRGSHSTLYGSSAIGGVINIITKSNHASPGVHLDVTANGGVFNKGGSMHTENLSLNYSDKSGVYALGEVFNLNAQGFNATTDTITNPATYKHPDMSDPFHKLDLLGKIGYRKNNLHVFAGFKTVSNKNNIDDGAFKDDDNYTIDMKRNLLTYGATYQINEKFSAVFNGGLTDNVREVLDDSSIVNTSGAYDRSLWEGTYKGKSSNQELQANYATKGLTMSMGGFYNAEWMTAKTRYYSKAWGIYESKTDLSALDIETTTSGGFFHADLNGALLSDKGSAFSLGLGVRFLNHSLFGNALTYEINPSLKLSENALLYVSYSTGFNAPSLYQLYTPEKDFTSGITRGNKTLKPEESQSIEIGLKQQVGSNLYWSMAIFNTVVNHSIDYVYLWNGTKRINTLNFLDYRGDTYINLGQQTNKGAEFTVSSKLNSQWTVTGNLSLVYGKLKYNAADIDPTQTQGNHVQVFSNGAFVTKETETIGLVRRPNTANVQLTYTPIQKLALAINGRFVGSRSDIFYDSKLGPFGALNTTGVSEYALVDFSARMEILKGLSAMVRVENIFNTSYTEIRGYACRGRGLYAGLRYAF